MLKSSEIKTRRVRQLHARDLDRINAAENRLNREALDALDYQAWPSTWPNLSVALKRDSGTEQ
jgi:hypothetical protein